ncbi:hypothetical protein DFH28DRAFT_948107 [Melampsora americana]|nr:hypothetical protein DFH28DRAFT_948107 [Melampsora americana]
MFFLKAFLLSVLIAIISTASIPEVNMGKSNTFSSVAQETVQRRSEDIPSQTIERRTDPRGYCPYDPSKNGYC